MITVNIHEAKTNLSKLLVMVEAGETITIAKAGHPIATIQPIAEKKPKRVFGLLKGKIPPVPDDFDEPDLEIIEAFEGKYDNWDEIMGKNKTRKKRK